MADFNIKDNPLFKRTMRKLETTDRAHASVFNALFEVLLDNDNHLKKAADKSGEELENKIDAKGGDVSNTVVSSLTDSTVSFPVPAAGDSQETLWGKVKKWQKDCLAKFGNYVLMSMITNQHLNSTSNIPTSALVYLMQQAIQQNQNAINVLNTKHKVMIKKYTKTIKIPANSFTGSIMLDIQPPSGLKAVGILGFQTDYPATITPTLWYLNKGNQIAFCLCSTYGTELTCTVFFHVLLLPESWDIVVND